MPGTGPIWEVPARPGFLAGALLAAGALRAVVFFLAAGVFFAGAFFLAAAFLGAAFFGAAFLAAVFLAAAFLGADFFFAVVLDFTAFFFAAM